MRGDEEADASMLEAVDAMEMRASPSKNITRVRTKWAPGHQMISALVSHEPESFRLFYFIFRCNYDTMPVRLEASPEATYGMKKKKKNRPPIPPLSKSISHYLAIPKSA